MGTEVPAAVERAVAWIRNEFGGLRDLPDEVIHVVWVSVYRGMELGLNIEERGGFDSLDEME
jgi:hypothetical protein